MKFDPLIYLQIFSAVYHFPSTLWYLSYSLCLYVIYQFLLLQMDFELIERILSHLNYKEIYLCFFSNWYDFIPFI